MPLIVKLLPIIKPTLPGGMALLFQCSTCKDIGLDSGYIFRTWNIKGFNSRGLGV